MHDPACADPKSLRCKRRSDLQEQACVDKPQSSTLRRVPVAVTNHNLRASEDPDVPIEQALDELQREPEAIASQEPRLPKGGAACENRSMKAVSPNCTWAGLAPKWLRYYYYYYENYYYWDY